MRTFLSLVLFAFIERCFSLGYQTIEDRTAVRRLNEKFFVRQLLSKAVICSKTLARILLVPRVDEASTHIPRKEQGPIDRVVEGKQLGVNVKLVIAVVALLGNVGMELFFDLSNLEISASERLIELVIRCEELLSVCHLIPVLVIESVQVLLEIASAVTKELD